jgi:hypothetical protein
MPPKVVEHIRSRIEAQSIEDLVDGLALGAKRDPDEFEIRRGHEATAAPFAVS